MLSRNRILLTFLVFLGCSAVAGLLVAGWPFAPAQNVASARAKAELVDSRGFLAQDFSQDSAVLAAVLANSCADSNHKKVLSSVPADPAEDTVAYNEPFKEAKAGMLRRSPQYFGSSEFRHGDRIELPPHCSGLLLASEKEIESALHGSIRGPTYPDWGNFSARFPAAVSVRRVSLPGYSLDGAHAVVYVSGSCGRLCGSGFSVSLERTTAGWVVVDAKTAWIS